MGAPRSLFVYTFAGAFTSLRRSSSLRATSPSDWLRAGRAIPSPVAAVTMAIQSVRRMASKVIGSNHVSRQPRWCCRAQPRRSNRLGTRKDWQQLEVGPDPVRIGRRRCRRQVRLVLLPCLANSSELLEYNAEQKMERRHARRHPDAFLKLGNR